MISQYEVIQSHISKFKDMLYTSLPARVIEVNYKEDYIESVDVIPSIARTYSDGDIRDRAAIYRVPIVFQSGGGGLLSFPIAINDTVLLIFNGDDNENFLEGSSKVPKTRRQFSYNDAIAIPCLYPFNSNLKPSKDKVEIKYKGSSISIDESGDILIDNAPNVTIQGATNVTVISDQINLESSIVNCTGDLKVTGAITGGTVTTSGGIDLDTHVHKGVVTGSGFSGVPK